jgi:mRNA-degrading endonuclease RelE of RelBE toxin-antitoxin system
MNSHTTDKFRKALTELPADIRKQARESYRLFVDNPRHPSLHFKPIHPTRPIYSARIGIHYRAVGILDGDDIIWYWIGHHSEYDRLIRTFKK